MNETYEKWIIYKWLDIFQYKFNEIMIPIYYLT